MTPKFFPLAVVTDQPERAEIAHHSLAISRRAGGCRAALGAMIHFQFVRLHRTRPCQFAILTPVAAGLKLVVGKSGQEKLIVPDARGRWRPRHRYFPQD